MTYVNNEKDTELLDFVSYFVVGDNSYSISSGQAVMTQDGEEIPSIDVKSGESATVTFAVDGLTQADYEKGFGLKFDEDSVATRHDSSGAKYLDTYHLKSISFRAELR